MCTQEARSQQCDIDGAAPLVHKLSTVCGLEEEENLPLFCRTHTHILFYYYLWLHSLKKNTPESTFIRIILVYMLLHL